MNTNTPLDIVTVLFTDIEGSTRLWEHDRERMARALALHDALARTAVESNCGTVVKMTGDGMYAIFADPVNALGATVALQLGIAEPEATAACRCVCAAACMSAALSAATTIGLESP